MTFKVTLTVEITSAHPEADFEEIKSDINAYFRLMSRDENLRCNSTGFEINKDYKLVCVDSSPVF